MSYTKEQKIYEIRQGKEKDVKAFLGMVMSEKWKEQEQLVWLKWSKKASTAKWLEMKLETI